MGRISQLEYEHVREISAEAVNWRRTIHSEPELLYDLPKTSALVAGLLRSFGCDDVVEGIAGSGVVAIVKGKHYSTRTTALRADMDALPITEATGAEYASRVPGRMHACGHDGHTATLLATAKFLSASRDFAGTAVFIFQPAEEGGAGAKAMLEAGVVERFQLDRIFALHTLPGLPVGQLATKPGVIMSASDRFVIAVKGRGGHAAMPHLANDPIVAAGSLMQAINAIVPRYLNPLDPVVLSVNSVHAGEAFNVIPDRVDLKGSLRTISTDCRARTLSHLDRICDGIGKTYGLEVVLEHIPLYPPTVNDEQATLSAYEVLKSELGEENVGFTDITMGAEDFSYFLEKLPGSYIWLGNGPSASLHSPSFDFNDTATGHGVAAFVSIVRDDRPL